MIDTKTMNRRVLLVDDESHILASLERTLRKRCDVTTAAGGLDALNQLRQSDRFSVIVTDMNMPGMNGVDFLKHAQEIDAETTRVMLTANAEQQTAQSAINTGKVFRFLTKPCELDVLASTVEEGIRAFDQLQIQRQEKVAEGILKRELESALQEQEEATQQAEKETVIQLITASKFRDQETGAHIRRVGHYCEQLALAVGWSFREASLIKVAAPLHDVGKIGIPDSILQKTGPLTPEEFEIMKTHTTIGATMLSSSRSEFLKLARIIALNHHERWDGQGYPNGIAGTQIPEAARMMAIADVYDALSHDRCYRPAFPASEVADMMRAGSGTQFDPDLLEVFMQLIPSIERLALEISDQ